MDLGKSISIAAAGLNAQSTRLRVVSENLANADSIATTPGGDPYRRKVVTFRAALDRAIGAQSVKVSSVKPVPGDFERRFDPGHPGADPEGYVRMPNVNSLIELTDMREAQRSYQANLSVIEAAKNMLSRAIDLLHG